MHPVKAARLAKGWRLVDLSQRCGASKPLISNIEHGYVPKPDRQKSIAAALGVTVESLWPVEAD